MSREWSGYFQREWVCPWGRGGYITRGWVCQGGGYIQNGWVCPGGMTYPMMQVMLPPPCEQTDACENITFPQLPLRAVKYDHRTERQRCCHESARLYIKTGPYTVTWENDIILLAQTM